MQRRTPPRRHATNALVRFADLLTARQADCPIDIRGRSAELWLDWMSRHRPADMARRSSSLSGFVDVWVSELGASEVSPVSTIGIDEYLKHLLARKLKKTTVWTNLNYLRSTIEDLGLATPDIRVALQKAINSDAVKGAKANTNAFRHTILRMSDVRAVVAAADPGDPLDVGGVALMLIMFECMADISELLGRPVKVVGAQSGLRLEDLDLTAERIRLTFPPPFPGACFRRCELSKSASAWLRHWLAMRGEQAGLVFFRRANFKPEADRRFVLHTMAAWDTLRRPGGALVRAGLDPAQVATASFKTGRALAMFESGYDLNHIAAKSSWTSEHALMQSLGKALASRRYHRARREPAALNWPLPGEVAPNGLPVQIMLF